MNILSSISILQKIYQVTCLSSWRIDRKSWRLKSSRLLEFYSFAVILTALGVFIYGLYDYDDFLLKSSQNVIGRNVDFIQLVGMRIAHIVSIMETLVRKKDQQEFYDQINEIDKIFERSLNVNIDNGKYRHDTLKRGFIIFMVYLVSESFILTCHLVTANQRNFYIYWLFYIFPTLVCGLRYFQIFTSISALKRRFTKLYETLQETHIEDPLDNSAKQVMIVSIADLKKTASLHYMPESWKIKKLLIIRDLYNRLFALTEILNHYFGISLLILVGNDFVSLTSNFYWTFINFKDFRWNVNELREIAVSAVWLVPHIMNLMMLVILCQSTVQSNSHIALALHRIQIDTLNDNQNSVIQQFSLQLLHQKISITAAGFFNIDCSLLYTIVAATTTYLIILIQFYLNEKSNR